MKFVLYGMPCAGKTTLLTAITDKLCIVNGSSWLNEHSDENFSSLSEEEKEQFRIKYTDYLVSLTDEHIISDGHYAFEDTIVFTEADGNVYDVFLYLYCEPAELLKRIKTSQKNQKYATLTVNAIEKWQDFEIEQLQSECHKRNKDFYVIKSETITSTDFSEFIGAIISGFSSYQLAVNLVEQIRKFYPTPCKLCIADGDKTFINEDSFRLCSRGFSTAVFDDDFYTGYQGYCFEKETSDIDLDYEQLQKCTVNNLVWQRITDENFVVLSAGITRLWERLQQQFNIPYVIATPHISADTKFFIGKILRNNGYYVKAYGDSKNDLYLLKEANEGYLYLGKRISRSLSKADTSMVSLLYDAHTFILEDNEDVTQEVAVCKSSSAVNGSRLALTHFELGRRLGSYIKQAFPNANTPVIVSERGGRFFGDGLYITFGGCLYPYNAKSDTIPDVKSNFIIIVDSVINTGNSILTLISDLKKSNPNVKVCIATYVIQREAFDKLREYTVFAVRVSDNKFVGKRQKKQTGNTGPDTADRLFNLL